MIIDPERPGKVKAAQMGLSDVPPPGSLVAYIRSFPGWIFVDSSEWNKAIGCSSGAVSEESMYAVVPGKNTFCSGYGPNGLEMFDIEEDTSSDVSKDPVLELARSIKSGKIFPSKSRHRLCRSGVPSPESDAIRSWRNPGIGGQRHVPVTR
jgi:hypothetical protein